MDRIKLRQRHNACTASSFLTRLLCSLKYKKMNENIAEMINNSDGYLQVGHCADVLVEGHEGIGVVDCHLACSSVKIIT